MPHVGQQTLQVRLLHALQGKVGPLVTRKTVQDDPHHAVLLSIRLEPFQSPSQFAALVCIDLSNVTPRLPTDPCMPSVAKKAAT